MVSRGTFSAFRSRDCRKPAYILRYVRVVRSGGGLYVEDELTNITTSEVDSLQQHRDKCEVGGMVVYDMLRRNNVIVAGVVRARL
jgi:hypothetical protein